MHVRRARPEELEAVGAITLAAYEPMLGAHESSYAEKLADAAARDREAELWIAVDGAELLGTVTRCPEGSPWRELAGPGEGEFRMLAVAPGAQGRGVGEALARHVVELFDEEGARAVVLSSTPLMATAHRLYERLGFRRWPERDWEPLPGVELLAFRKELA